MNIITTLEQLDELVAYYAKQPAFAFDVESVCLACISEGVDCEHRGKPERNDVTWLSLATEGRVDVIPMGHQNGEFLRWDKPMLKSGLEKLTKGKEPKDPDDYSKNEKTWVPKFGPAPDQLFPGQVFGALRPIFFSDKLKIGHNIKFDLKSIAKYYRGVVPYKPFFDTMIATFIIDNRTRIFGGLGLDDCAKRELGVEVKKGVGKDVTQHSFDEVAEYSGIDAEITWRLYQALSPRVEGDLARVWKLEMDVLAALCDMELAGAYLDIHGLEALANKLKEDLETVKARAFKCAGRPFNLNANREKQNLLFGPKSQGYRGLVPNTRSKVAFTPKGLENVRMGKEPSVTDYAVSSEALQELNEKSADPLVAAILEYQELNKIMTTYVMPYLGGEVERTTAGKTKIVTRESLLYKGRAHTDFVQHGADTGRFSSRNPNLQNIPSGGDYGKLIRNLFIAPDGYKLVVADYSQIEPRIIASLSEDPIMIKNYLEGGDIYTTIGDTMGVDRKAGKVLVLSIAYGVGPDKIAQSIGCKVKEAKELLDDFSDRFNSIAKYKARVIRQARQQAPTPFVSTLFGRRRYIPELKSKELGLVNRAERQAFNTVIQGSAADLMKLAIVRAHSCFTEEPEVNVLLTVHDELVTITPEHLADEVEEAIRDSMESIKIPSIKVPLVADVHIVQKWGDAK